MKLFFIWTFNLRMEPEIFQKGNFFHPSFLISYVSQKKRKKLAEIIIALEICW